MRTDTQGFAPVPGTALYYEVTGDGPPIVLLHGFGFDRRMWDDQVPALSRRYTVVRYDLRGFGRSAPAAEPYTHADDLMALLAHLGLGRVVVMGLSLGGGAALNFAIAYPEATRALILVDPTLGGFAWSPEMVAAQGAPRAASQASGVEAGREVFLDLPLFTQARKNPAVAARIRALVADYHGWHWLHPDAGRPFSPPAITRLGEIHVPTLVVVGAFDTPDFHTIADTVTDAVPDARKVILADAGHMANLEAPEAFNETVLGFLAGLDGAPAADEAL